MSFLILLSSLSFLILSTMISLRLFGCSFNNRSVYYRLFKKSNKYLSRFFWSLRKKVLKYRGGLLFLIYIGKFLLFYIIKLYDIISFFLKKIKVKCSNHLKRASLKEKGETVSEYLRNISDYKK